MKNISRRLSILTAMMLITVMSLSSCGINSLISGEKDRKQYTESKNIYLAMADVRTLNPVISKDEDTYMISKVIYDSLFEIDENMVPQPKLVESYEFDQMENSLTIDVAQDRYFHDRSTFNAYDVRFSINAYRNAGSLSLYRNHVKNIKKVSVESMYRLKIYYNSGKDMALSYLTFPILPSSRHENAYELISDREGFRPVGTGPYRFRSYNESRGLKLVPNEDYIGENAENNLIFKVLPKKKYQFRLIESGNISAAFSDRRDRYAQVTDPDISHVDFPGRSVEYLAFNCRKGAASDSRIRKAIAYAIDTDTIRKECYYNTCTFCDSLYYPGYMGCDIDRKFYRMDDAKVTECLSKAGCRDKDGDGILEVDGRNIRLKILVHKGDESRQDAAKIIKEELSNYRIDASVKRLSRAELKSRLSAGRFDIYIGGYDFDETFDLRPLLGRKSENCTGYEDVDIIDKLNYIRSGITPDEAKPMVMDIKEKLSDELPYYPLFYKTCGVMLSEQIKGSIKPQFNNYLKNCRDWKCKFEKTVDNQTKNM